MVLREAQLREPDVEQIAPVKYNSLLAFPHLAARLRSRVDPEAVRIAVTALALRDGYEPPARVELFGELAGVLPLAGRVSGSRRRRLDRRAVCAQRGACDLWQVGPA